MRQFPDGWPNRLIDLRWLEWCEVLNLPHRHENYPMYKEVLYTTDLVALILGDKDTSDDDKLKCLDWVMANSTNMQKWCVLVSNECHIAHLRGDHKNKALARLKKAMDWLPEE